jgi:hypothetical protein
MERDPSGERAGAALGPAGFGTQKVPKYESKHGQNDHEHGPQDFFAGIRCALKNIDDCPNIGNQHNQTEDALVLHVSLSLLLDSSRYATPLRSPREWKIVRLAGPGWQRAGAEFPDTIWQ